MTQYPSRADLRAIEDAFIPRDTAQLIVHLRQIWQHDYGILRWRGGYLVLITGGWSGNEDIIYALQKNTMWWTLFWEKSERGGKFTFRVKI